ncbi:hypothetical protein RQP46_007260 [Phenoliferia psychrophenolica]
MLRVTSFLLAVAVTAASAQSPLSKRAPLKPDVDPFYLAPSDWNQSSPAGTVLRSRSIQPAFVSVIPIPLKAYQLLYTTTDALGEKMVTVTTIVIPPNADRGKLAAYATPEDSSSSMCAPSYSSVITTIPDHEGPTSTFAAGRKSGMAVLDGIRATMNFRETIGLDASAKSVAWGYSGGAQAAGWAAALKETYAPELNMVGVAQGGTPVDMRKVLLNVNKGFGSGLVVGGLVGLSAAYPELGDAVQAVLTPKGKELLEDNKKHCLVDLKATFVDVFEPTYINGGQAVMDTPYVKENRLGANATLTPKMPLHVVHGSIDELIPYEVEKDMAKAYCAAGANLEFVTGPFLGHVVSLSAIYQT